MLTDTVRRPSLSPARFAIHFAAWSIGLFGVLRLGWLSSHLIAPFTSVQASLAVALFGTPVMPITATLECSGTDALALCVSAILAYPARWRRKLGGLIVGLALVIGLNIVRIGTLGQAASARWFNALHLYIWPLLLTIAIGGFLFIWMRGADAPVADPLETSQRATVRLPLSPRARLFVMLTVTLMLLFLIVSPSALDNRLVLDVATFMASVAARLLSSIGIEASTLQNVLITPRGALMVTQECITTPLIPVYLAAVWAFGRHWQWRVIGIAATVPLFVALGIARLLVVALPSAIVSSPVFVIHAFYQLLLGAVVVGSLAIWRHGRAHALKPAALGIVAGSAFVWLLGSDYTNVIALPSGLPANDPQGAIAFLPAFQTGLYLAIWLAAFLDTRWQAAVGGLAALVLTQTLTLLLLRTAGQAGTATGVVDVRAWAVAGPLLIFVLARYLCAVTPLKDLRE